MLSQAEFRTAVTEEVGDLSALVDNAEVDRWVNEGRTRIGAYKRSTATVTWAAGDPDVDLPADCVAFVRLHGDDVYLLGRYTVWGTKLVLHDPDGASGSGTATAFYRAYYPQITGAADSELSEEADRGLISYALFRFFKKLSSSRSEYRRYSTLVGQNAVQIEDLQVEADRHYNDFVESSEALPLDPPTIFYGR